MESDMVKTNMKHSKGVCENDSISIFGDCSSNELLELFKSKNSTKNLSVALQAIIDPLDNQLGYMGKQETLQA